MRLDPNLYAKVALQKIVLAEDGVACEDFIRAMRQITETREWDPECQTRQCDYHSVRENINSSWTVSITHYCLKTLGLYLPCLNILL